VGKKVTLPLLPSAQAASAIESPAQKPSIDAARKRLGGLPAPGRGASPAGIAPGAVVAFGTERDLGVVIYADAAEVHVLLDSVRLRRLTPHDVDVHVGEAPVSMAKIAADAQLFARLSEGERIRYADDAGNLVDGKLVERCRWGALVLREDGAIIAVGFRKIWPSTSHGAA
jgi:hypothetical protein